MSLDTGRAVTDIGFCPVCRALPASLFVFRQRPGRPRRFLAFTDDIERYTGETAGSLVADAGRLWQNIHPDDHAAIDAAGERAVATLADTQV